MIDIHLKYGDIHINEIFYNLICINNDINSCINCMLSKIIRGHQIFLTVEEICQKYLCQDIEA